MAGPSPFTDPRAEEAYIRQRATQLGIDPEAVFAVAAHEGITLPAQVGDKGTSFGPWQLHAGGRLPAQVWQQGASYARSWADSQAGIDYALQGIAAVAGGQRGPSAIHSIVYGFEHPADPASETRAAVATYQSGGGPGPNISGMLPTNPYDPVVAGIGAGKAVVGGVTAGIHSVEDAISFVTSWRFAEIIGGVLLLIVGLILLGKSLGMQTPRTPFDRYASRQPTSREGVRQPRKQSYTLEADQAPAPRPRTEVLDYGEVPF